MFAYSDPTSTGTLQQVGALQTYREAVDVFYQRFHAEAESAFTLAEAFNELAPGTHADTTRIEWKAFPISAGGTPAQIDRDRFSRQDEYVEWRVEKSGASITAITFITEFKEYYAALASVGPAALKREIGNLYPGSNPTEQELFGSGADPVTQSPRTRAERFVQNLPRNPWNNGDKGILCLTHPSNTMGALFGLLGACAVPTNVDPSAVCGLVGGACVPGRNSDPAVCAAAQQLARSQRSFTLEDPASIRIVGLDRAGSWTVDGQAIDINDTANNRGLWTIARNGLRATFKFQGNVRLDGAPIQSGAQLAAQLNVGATVRHAPDTALPEWARRGNESFRGPIA